MSTNATILNIFCVRPSNGTNTPVVQAVVNALNALDDWLPDPSGSIHSFIEGLPAVISAIDTALDSPDDFYITKKTTSGSANNVWPKGTTLGTTIEMLADQSETPDYTLSVNNFQNISLWDSDLSGDDHLGSIRMEEGEAKSGERITKLAKSTVQGSAYYVTYVYE